MTKEQAEQIAKLIIRFYGVSREYDLYEIIKDFDYAVARKAVIEYAKTDISENISLPAPGIIYQNIEHTAKLYEGIKDLAKVETSYDDLNETAQALISRENYNKLLLMDAKQINETEIRTIAE